MSLSPSIASAPQSNEPSPKFERFENPTGASSAVSSTLNLRPSSSLSTFSILRDCGPRGWPASTPASISPLNTVPVPIRDDYAPFYGFFFKLGWIEYPCPALTIDTSAASRVERWTIPQTPRHCFDTWASKNSQEQEGYIKTFIEAFDPLKASDMDCRFRVFSEYLTGNIHAESVRRWLELDTESTVSWMISFKKNIYHSDGSDKRDMDFRFFSQWFLFFDLFKEKYQTQEVNDPFALFCEQESFQKNAWDIVCMAHLNETERKFYRFLRVLCKQENIFVKAEILFLGVRSFPFDRLPLDLCEKIFLHVKHPVLKKHTQKHYTALGIESIPTPESPERLKRFLSLGLKMRHHMQTIQIFLSAGKADLDFLEKLMAFNLTQSFLLHYAAQSLHDEDAESDHFPSMLNGLFEKVQSMGKVDWISSPNRKQVFKKQVDTLLEELRQEGCCSQTWRALTHFCSILW